MDNKDQAKTNRLEATETFLLNNETVFSTDVAFKKLRAKVGDSKTEVAAKAAAAGINNTGFSQIKQDAKVDMAEEAATLSGYAYVYFDEIGRTDLSSQCHINITDYLSLADPAAASLAQAAHKLMSDHQTELDPEGVTAANLTALQTKIATFTNAQGTSGMVHQVSAADTASFKASIAVADDRIAKLLILAKRYKKTAPEFYNKLILATTLPPVNVHHTTVSITVVDATNNAAIAGAVATVESYPNKQGTSDATGVLHIEKVKSGNRNITVAANGHSSKTVTVAVQSGKDNTVTVAL